MNSLPIFSSPRMRYVWFIVWGLGDGAVVYFFIAESIGRSARGDIRLAAGCILAGGVISAVVFGILLRCPQVLRAAGFLIVGALTPWLGMAGSHMLYCGCFELFPDPLAVVAILLWTAFSLPLSILSAAVYFFIWFLSRSQAKARSPTV
jgi:hypothetical protein